MFRWFHIECSKTQARTTHCSKFSYVVFGLQLHKAFSFFCTSSFVQRKRFYHGASRIARLAWVPQPKRSCRHLFLDHLDLHGGCDDVLLDGNRLMFLTSVIESLAIATTQKCAIRRGQTNRCREPRSGVLLRRDCYSTLFHGGRVGRNPRANRAHIQCVLEKSFRSLRLGGISVKIL